MKFLKRIGIGILILLLLIIVISFFLPSKVHIEQSVEMKTKREVSFAFVNDLRKWKQWSHTLKIDTTAEILFSENSQNEGAWCKWKSKNPEVGEAKITITKSILNSFIELEIDFASMGIKTLIFRFDSSENGTKATWIMDSDSKGIPWYFYVVSKYANLFMEKNIRSTLDKSLLNLKTICEAIPQKETVAGFDVDIIMLDKIYVLSIRDKIKNKEFGKRIGENFSAIAFYIDDRKIKVTGAPFIILHKMMQNESDVEFAIPVDSTTEAGGEINFHSIDATEAMVVKYFGAYDKTVQVYEAANKFIESKNKKQNGPPREIYITDPGIEKDTSKWLTEIIFPVK